MSRSGGLGDWLGSASWLATGSLFSQLFNFLAIPALARVFDPAVLGLWAVIQSYVLLAAGVAGLRYELALPLVRAHAVQSIIRIHLLLNVAVTILATGWLMLIPPAEVDAAIRDVGELLMWVSVATLIGGVAHFQLVSQYCVRKGHFGRLAIARLISAAGGTAVQLFLGVVYGGRVAALVLGAAMATVGAALVGGLRMRIRRKASNGGEERLELYEIARVHKRFPMFVVPYGFVTLLRDRGLLLLLASYLSLDVVGLVAMAQRIVAVPVGFASSAVGPVVHRRLAAADDPKVFEQAVGLVLRIMIWVGAPSFVLLALLAQSMAPLALGEEWAEVGPLCTVLAISGFTLFLSGLLDRSFDIVQKQSMALWIEGANSVVTLSVVWILLAKGASASQTMLGYALVNALHNLVWIVAAWRSLGFSAAGMRRLARHLFGSVALMIMVWSIASWML